jgi:hypothetical protein
LTKEAASEARRRGAVLGPATSRGALREQAPKSVGEGLIQLGAEVSRSDGVDLEVVLGPIRPHPVPAATAAGLVTSRVAVAAPGMGVAAVRAAGVQDNAGAVGREPFGAAADALARAGDEGAAAGEVEGRAQGVAASISSARRIQTLGGWAPAMA